MRRVFVIFKDENYREVSHEEYDAFDGEKFTAPPHWRMLTIYEWLLSYRY